MGQGREGEEMIYTRFGSPVRILEFDEASGEAVIKREEDGMVWEVHVSELKADGGLNEIWDAIEKGEKNG